MDFDSEYIILATGFIFYFIMYGRYRNANKRHSHETETKKVVSDIKKVDNFIEHRRGLRNSRLNGANNTIAFGDKTKNKFINKIKK